MSSREIARQWFIPGDGIDRHVISADIQRYLGNDATVRPGVGNGDHEGAQGYWIKAYRNLTTAMLADLRADSAKWRQEQRVTGTRGSRSPLTDKTSGITVPDPITEPYVGSSTHHASVLGKPDRRHGDSPVVEGPYAAPPPARERAERSDRDRIERERITASRLPPGRTDPRIDSRIDPSDRMDIDPPPVAQPDRRYAQPERERGYQPEGRAYPPEGRAYPPDSRAYPPDSRAYPPESRQPYQQDQPMPPAYGRPPVTTSYPQDSRYAPSYPQHDGAPPGYVRQGNYFVPVSAYEPASAMPPGRSEPPQYPNGPYGQPTAQGRDTREPRYGGQPEYAEPRYAYPSPATTTVSVSGRDREPVTSPPQPSPYSSINASQYDQYGRPVMSPPAPEERRVPPSRDSNYGRERAPVNANGGDAHRSSRRRVQ
ncbi:hypothetical protein LTR56_006823 [Elasticomyces elasticus]|nr:hypothetical protein LTR56_006823 [Elasticomyces elasticus]KAK4923236.1 hypothetical protein LTR49_009499 [Elasticomyces elasticus]KAK5757660.1 hypothetical protein LTS12_012262 [Elasticomyces elasticus]